MNLSPRGRAVAFVLAALALASIIFPDFAIWASLLVVILVVAAEGVWVKLATRRPESRFILSRQEEPAENRVLLHPEEESVERVQFVKKVGGRVELKSTIDFLQIEPGVIRGVGRSVLELRFRTEYAGDYSATRVGIEVTSPIGIFSSRSDIPFSVEYLVYPRVLQVAAATVRLLNAAEIGETPVPVPGVGTEYYEMRRYQPMDDVRDVNWKASAREGELVVTERMKEVGSSYLLMLDTRAAGFAETDRLASTFLTIANSLGAAGVNFGVLVHDGTRVTVFSAGGDTRLSLSLALRAALSVTKIEASPEFLELTLTRTSRLIGSGDRGADLLALMQEMHLSELRSSLEDAGPWVTAAGYLRETQVRSLVYVSALSGDLRPLIELVWEAWHYRNVDFSVANPCKEAGDQHGYHRLARAIETAGARYVRGEPVELARRILTG